MASWASAFEEVTALNHKDQAIWWLNGFWNDGAEEEKETIWELAHLAMETETGVKVLYGRRKVEANYTCDLDEMKAHIFLEKLGETLTVRALRARLKDLDVDNNKRMAICEYLLAKYNKTPEQVAFANQGGGASMEELEEAQRQLEAAMAAMLKAQEAAQDAAEALAAQKAAEAALKKAESELRAALEELEAQQAAFDNKKAGFQAKIDDESLSSMKRNMARNELAQMNSEDPLPLRKAKITQAAAVKRAEKARKRGEEARLKAEADKQAADEALDIAIEAKNLCEASLNELKKKAGVPHGRIWWMERELKEAQKFMPSK